ncbi:MAG: carbohydrate kinase [Oligosphaeraceae bacterium]|nr:carbohydrate kinase [Oligosphaeraceae bacterium]
MGCFLGLDASTQSLKALLVNTDNGSVSDVISVHFGKELPEFNCPDGFLPNEDSKVRHADPLLWLAAMDLLFHKISLSRWPLTEIKGISGSGQQHGTVYLNKEIGALLQNLTPAKSLAEQLRPGLSRATAPIWMDASTTEECDLLREKFGMRMRRDTGSDAAERFSGPQIMKFAREEAESWAGTGRVHLVSSFLASVLAGESMPVDYGDGAGMNLLNLHTLQWDRDISQFIAPGLLAKLPKCVPSCTVPGKLPAYFTKYGLPAGIPLVVWSGDNPSSLIGCGGATRGSAVISLGTSDTFFGSMATFSEAPQRYGHVFGNPAGGFMSLICFTNGSLAREKMRQKFSLSWEEFNQAAEVVEPGKRIMLPFFMPESTPTVASPCVHADFDLDNATPGESLRALLESQALTMKIHAELKQPPSFIRLTGGASANNLLQQIIADVFQTEVCLGESPESAALGAALRAANAVEKIPFETLTKQFCKVSRRIEPVRERASVYDHALNNFRKLLRNAHPDK